MYESTKNYLKGCILKLIEQTNDESKEQGRVTCDDIRNILNEIECKDKYGPDCSDICCIVYYILCDKCEEEDKCHKDCVDHDKLLECSLKYLTVKNTVDEFEDNIERDIIIKIAKNASDNAVEETFNMDAPITILENGHIVKKGKMVKLKLLNN
jgi:hypothetical protein